MARRGEADLGMLRGLKGGKPVWHGVSPRAYSRAHTYANDSFSLLHNAIALLAGVVAVGPSGGEMPALVYSYTHRIPLHLNLLATPIGTQRYRHRRRRRRFSATNDSRELSMRRIVDNDMYYFLALC